MSDYISVHTGAVIDNAVTTVINGKAGIQGIISNGTEIEPNQNNKVSINIPDISQSTGDSTTSTMSQNAITNQLREKANADLLNNYYQKTESYSKTEIDNMIATIPKFDIKVVLTLPTENISESTIYLVPTQQEEGGLYQEYVYINSRWELIGGQSVDLSDYYTKQVIDNLLNDKLDTGEVVQTTGYNTDKVMSQKAVTDIVNDKFDKSSIDNYYNKSETNNLLNDRININKISQSAGNSTTNVMSQQAITDLLDTKIDKSVILQATGNSTTSVMSQNAITENLNLKADKSDLNNYYTKSETYTQTEIDDKITRIPQFDIQVVDELPTTNISPTTVYIVPSTVGDETIYQEYIYSDNEWKLLGDQTVDLSDYYNKAETDSLLSNKVDKSSIVQATGNSTTSVMSQDAVTDALDGKIDKSAIEQGPGQSNLGIMSQKAVTDALNGKMDRSFYEEDTWTPEIGQYKEENNNTTYYNLNGFIEYQYNYGHYIRIGKLCHVNFAIKVRSTNTNVILHWATIYGFPYRASSRIGKQTLTMCDIGFQPFETDYSKLHFMPGVSYELRSDNGTHAHIEHRNGLQAVQWPLYQTDWIYVSGSGAYIID